MRVATYGVFPRVDRPPGRYIQPDRLRQRL